MTVEQREVYGAPIPRKGKMINDFVEAYIFP